jgi:spore germination cell wall hydrolase CwlJ-like protein
MPSTLKIAAMAIASLSSLAAVTASGQPYTAEPVVAIPAINVPASPPDDAEQPVPLADAEPATSLDQLVARYAPPATLDDETRCLATAIYFEARNESLAGQLAVARVIINRAQSGRFPTSLCAVVKQPGQFSFVRRGAMPDVAARSRDWSDALAIAAVARDNRWKSDAEGALFFHAARVSPGWRMQRVARIDNHIFYR